MSLPIASLGVMVTGVDLARPMLRYARVKAMQQQLPVNLIEADARHLHLNRQFSFIFLTGNAFQAFLNRSDQELLLASVKRHLAPNGIFAFETRNPYFWYATLRSDCPGYALDQFPAMECSRKIPLQNYTDRLPVHLPPRIGGAVAL